MNGVFPGTDIPASGPSYFDRYGLRKICDPGRCTVGTPLEGRAIRLRLASALALVVMLAAVVTGHVVTKRAVATEDRERLQEKARDVAGTAVQVGSRIEGALAALRAVVAATGADPGAFERAVKPNVDSGIFTGVALLELRPEGPAPVVQSGTPLQLLQAPLEEIAHVGEAAQTEGLVPAGRFNTPRGTLFGFLFGPAEGPSPRVVYAEVPLASIPQLIAAALGDATDADVLADYNLAVYSDKSERPQSLVLAFARELPLRGHRFVQPVKMGTGHWYVVISAGGHLVSDLDVAMPWILLVVGLLASALVTALLEMSLRRRRALRESERRFRLLVQNSSDFIGVIDADGQIRYISPSVEKMLGYSPEDAVGASIVDFLHPDDAEQVIATRFDDPTQPEVISCRARAADGTWRHLEITGTELLDEPAVAGIVVNCRDVTERKAAEEERVALASIIEATSDLVATSDAEGRITYMNAAGRQLLGLDATGLPGISMSDIVSEESRAQFGEGLEAAGREGTWTGEATMVTTDGRRIPVWSVVLAHLSPAGAIERFSTITRDISERKALEEQLAHQAFHCPLTDLANRALLADRLGHALARSERSGQPVSVILVDLDDFKTINDGLGHAAGDELLVALADRLRASIRAGDTLARLGGDEFALVLEDTAEPDAVDAAKRLLDAFRLPFRLGEDELFLSASIGITVHAGGSADPDALLRDADVAMYEAKAEGKSRWQMFAPHMRTVALERLGLGADLRRAVESDEFVLHYQPVVSLERGQVMGFEALLRWQKPGYGIVPPLRFIPLAEESGLIVPIGRWVLQEACRQLGAWHARHPGASSLYMSVNVSGRQLRDAGLVDDVRDAIRTGGIRPEHLIIEITESVLVQCGDVAAERIEELRQLGIRLAMDDFGTGYSSLSSLQHLPVDILKIDKSFVDGLKSGSDGSKFVSTIVQLGRAMKLDIVAEGIEQSNQLEHLSALDCNLGQGFYFARPLEVDQAEALLDSPPPAFLPAAPDGADATDPQTASGSARQA